MGNCCSTPQPISGKPAPKSGEPTFDPELVQLRSQIDMARNTLKTLVDKLPILKTRLSHIPPKVENNAGVMKQVVNGLAPIDDEIQSKLAEDSEAETTVCAERKQELMDLVSTAEGFDGQKHPAESVDTELGKESQEIQQLYTLLGNLAVRAAPYSEELEQVKDLLSKCSSLQQEVSTLEPVSATTRTSATVQEDEWDPIRERLNRYAAIDEVVEESGQYVEVQEEQVLAAEVINDFEGVEEFFDEGVYSTWLSGNSVLLRAFRYYNQPTYMKADLGDVISTFERLMLEKSVADAECVQMKARPLDVDYYVFSSLIQDAEVGPQRFCSFMSGLLDAVRHGQYPEIIARVLGIHDTRAVAPSWAGSMPEIMKRFEKLFNFLKVSKAVTSRLNEMSDEETFPELLSGGQINMSVAVNELFAMLQGNSTTAVAWIRRLKPASISEENFLLYLLCNRMKSVNTDSNKLFKDLTSARGLELGDFAAGLKKKFNLMLSEEEFQLLFDRIDRTHSGAIPRVCFTQEVKLTWYYDQNSKTDFTLSKCQFLDAFLSLGSDYMKTVAWETYLATKTLRCATYDYPTSDFDNIAAALDEKDPSALLVKVQETSGRPAEEHFGIDELVRYGLKRPFGFLGQFVMTSEMGLPQGDLPDELKSLVEEMSS